MLRRGMMILQSVFQLIRPFQWVKNLMVFVPLFFGGAFFDTMSVMKCLPLFVAFCMVSSGIYCLNDVVDVAYDRVHPKKCRRPVASGRLSRTQALVVMTACFLMSALVCVVARFSLLMILSLLVYVSMNVLYTFWLKRVAVMDVCIIALGFVIRVYCCHFACGIYVSHWIVMMVFLAALFLAMSKRLSDVKLWEKDATLCREVAHSYSPKFLSIAIYVVSSIMIVCYVMYSVDEVTVMRLGTSYLYVTSLFVLVGVLRYLMLVFSSRNEGNPIKLLFDKYILLCLVLWGLFFIYIIYC